MTTHNCFTALRAEISATAAATVSHEETQLPDPSPTGSLMKKLTDKMQLVACPECQKLTKRGNLYKCGVCSKPKCICKCLDYCRKCKKAICSQCTTYCPNCFVTLCEVCQATYDHCHVLHFFNFEMSDGAYMYIYDIKAGRIRRNKFSFPNANSDLLDSAFVDQTIYICGGRKTKSDSYLALTVGLLLNPDLSLTQKGLASMQVPKCAHRLMGSPWRQLYCLGGTNASGPLSQCEVYRIEKNYWTNMASMHEPRVCPTVLLAGKLLYVFGALNQCATSVEEYNTNTNIWVSLQLEERGSWKGLGRGIGLQVNEDLLLFESDGNSYLWNPSAGKILPHTNIKSPTIFVQTKPIISGKYIYLFDNNETLNQLVTYSITSRSWRLTTDWGKLCS